MLPRRTAPWYGRDETVFESSFRSDGVVGNIHDNPETLDRKLDGLSYSGSWH